MKVKLLIEGKEVEAEISENELKKLAQSPSELTGYEAAGSGCRYFYADEYGTTKRSTSFDDNKGVEEDLRCIANYYTDEKLAKDCIRADTLMRRLRRFSAEHRDSNISWKRSEGKWTISGLWENYEFTIEPKEWKSYCISGAVYFDTEQHANQAIDQFYEELVWYFTEFCDTAKIFSNGGVQ